MRLSALGTNSMKFLCRVVIAATLVRAFIPAGFMPDLREGQRGDGLFPLVICAGLTGKATVYLPASALPEAPAQDNGGDTQSAQDHSPCAFSSVLAFGLAAEKELQEVPHIKRGKTRIISAQVPAASVAVKAYRSQAPPAA